MTWHETIEFIRNKPEYADLVEKAYFEKDLVLNVSRFGDSEEFKETLKLIRQLRPSALTLLEIGAGNGIATINLALNGFDVTSVEPDTSDTVGSNAIKQLARHYRLDNVTVFEKYAEEIAFPDASFDIVYIRQAMHHAYDLDKFIGESARVLKKGGLLVTVRDHVIFDEQDKEWFLQNHPLHRFYGGENAFTREEYADAFHKAGLEIIKELRHYDSVINYFPMTQSDMNNEVIRMDEQLKEGLSRKIGVLARLPLALQLYKRRAGFNRREDYFNEKNVPGRMYSYLAEKK